MSETWTLNDCTLILGDCLEVLPTLTTGSVDAVVTDPPYGVGFKYESHKDCEDGYGEFLWKAVEFAERTACDGSPVMVWQAAKNARFFHEWFPREWRLLIAAKNFAQVLPGPTWPSYEPVVTWWKGGNGKSFGTCNRDYFLADTTPSGRKRRGELVNGHPCPRPIQHAEWLVGTWTSPHGTVLDPFMGSGTTGVACIRTGRKFIGIEQEPKYFEIAKRRITEDYESQALLAGANT